MVFLKFDLLLVFFGIIKSVWYLVSVVVISLASVWFQFVNFLKMTYLIGMFVNMYREYSDTSQTRVAVVPVRPSAPTMLVPAAPAPATLVPAALDPVALVPVPLVSELPISVQLVVGSERQISQSTERRQSRRQRRRCFCAGNLSGQITI